MAGRGFCPAPGTAWCLPGTEGRGVKVSPLHFFNAATASAAIAVLATTLLKEGSSNGRTLYYSLRFTLSEDKIKILRFIYK